MGKFKGIVVGTLLAVMAVSAVGCTKKEEAKKNDITGQVKVDGSSTVAPITQAVTEAFNGEYPGIKVSIGISGTGGGFKKYVAGETDINDASRAIKPEEEEKAKAKGIESEKLEVAYDGIAVVVSKENNWVKDIKVEDLKKIWEPNSKVKLWSDVNPAWPKEPIKLYGPGTDSGTFEYFTEAINGKAKAIRTDFTASEDDNVLVQGVSNDKYAMGYFGAAYYEENANKLNALKINGVELKKETIADKTYAPLSRPLYIYVSKTAAKRPEVAEFLNFYMKNVKDFVSAVGYFPLEDAKYQEGINKVKEITTK
ncbi:PstS family phosphate ABC transporter substrate-binding protein [Clostridium cylindrosporum]|uniref:Phosphate-binding protein n=1 Tax=Clostridium cylindrosporum DSM 605 TaxID=1121307 RepID=A0A0J8DDY9_CLOCY|nr:PstS family phosphate ABC transporter substrate-binding protein [Clostridium cylindrosporum]KMT22444.1 phosphate binding protein [Clostridium cylindrosporum DSM 605]